MSATRFGILHIQRHCDCGHDGNRIGCERISVIDLDVLEMEQQVSVQMSPPTNYLCSLPKIPFRKQQSALDIPLQSQPIQSISACAAGHRSQQ